MKTKTNPQCRRPLPARRTETTPRPQPETAPRTHQPAALPGATQHEFLSFAFYPGAIEPLVPAEYQAAI